MSWRSDTGSPTRSGAPSGFRPQTMGSGGFCCQVPPNPAWRSLTRQGFKSVFQTALRSLGNRSIVVVGNYEFGPITAEPCRAKARPLRPRRSYFAPVWWRRRVLPPGPMGLLRRPFITIAGLRRHHEYSRPRLTKKERLQAPVPAARAGSGSGDAVPADTTYRLGRCDRKSSQLLPVPPLTVLSGRSTRYREGGAWRECGGVRGVAHGRGHKAGPGRIASGRDAPHEQPPGWD